MKILGTRIVLRDERREGDEEDFCRWWNLEEWQYYDEPDVVFKRISRAEYERQLQELRRRRREPAPDSHAWQIDTLAGRHIGWVNYYHLDAEAGRAYVGICLPEEDMWGQGYGTEALRYLVDHLLTEMELEEVRTATWTGNQRMMRCAEKSGFHELARMPHRADTSVRGEPLERIEFSISRGEWLAQRGAG